jgi:hypothetical protein
MQKIFDNLQAMGCKKQSWLAWAKKDLKTIWGECEDGEFIGELLTQILPEKIWRPVIRAIAFDAEDNFPIGSHVWKYLKNGDETIRDKALEQSLKVFGDVAFPACLPADEVQGGQVVWYAATSKSEHEDDLYYSKVKAYAGLIKKMITVEQMEEHYKNYTTR